MPPWMMRRLLAEVAAAEVVPLDQRHLESAQRGVPGDAGALDAAPDDQHVVLGAGELVEVPPHRSDRLAVGRPVTALPEARPLADPVGPAVRRAEMDDDLADQPEPQELNPERQQQDREQQQRPVGDALALDAVHQQHERW